MLSSVALALIALFGSLFLGIVVHESLHLLVLRRAGVDCSLTVESTRNWRSLQAIVAGRIASVELESIPSSCSPWHLRLAALAPLAMVPVAGGYVALVGGGLAADTLVGSMVLVGWLACALPSPADFSIVWRPEETINRVATGQDERVETPG